MEQQSQLNYNDSYTPTENRDRLRKYLMTHDADLYTNLLNEEERFSGTLTKKRVRLLYSHFRKESKRKATQESHRYVYRPIEEEQLIKVYGPSTVEEQARRLAAADARIKMLEKLRDIDMIELASLIKEFRERGLVTDVQTDAILEKVASQCEPLRQENQRLREQLDERGLNTVLQTTQLENEGLRWRLDELHNELAELRRQLAETVILSDQVEFLTRANQELLAKPQEQETAASEMSLQIFNLYAQILEQHEQYDDLRKLVNEKDSQIETLERDLSGARARETWLERENKNLQSVQALQSVQERVVDRQDEQMNELRIQLDEMRRQNTRLQQMATLAPDPTALRRELEEVKREYNFLLHSAIDTESEFSKIVQEEIDELRGLPVHRLNEDGVLELIDTETLGELNDRGRPFYIIAGESDRVLQARHPHTTQPSQNRSHARTIEEDSLRALLVRAAHAQSGRSRVRLTQEDSDGVKQFEALFDALAPQKIASFRPLELVLDAEQSQRVRYTHSGALPRRMMSARGQLRVQRYNADRPVGTELTYDYELEGNGARVINFPGGATLYASYISPTLYRLDMLVLPFE